MKQRFQSLISTFLGIFLISCASTSVPMHELRMVKQDGESHFITRNIKGTITGDNSKSYVLVEWSFEAKSNIYIEDSYLTQGHALIDRFVDADPSIYSHFVYRHGDFREDYVPVPDPEIVGYQTNVEHKANLSGSSHYIGAGRTNHDATLSGKSVATTKPIYDDSKQAAAQLHNMKVAFSNRKATAQRDAQLKLKNKIATNPIPKGLVNAGDELTVFGLYSTEAIDYSRPIVFGVKTSDGTYQVQFRPN